MNIRETKVCVRHFQHAVTIDLRTNVRPSVIWVDQLKTVEVGIMQFPPNSSPIPLVFVG